MEVDTGFLMDAHDMGSEIAYLTDVALGLFDHEVYVEWFFCYFGDGFHDGETEADVGHEVAIHDIEMVPMCAALVEQLYVIGEMTEIGRE